MSVEAAVFRRFERRFYLGASLGFLALVFATFARSYYLKGVFGTRPLPALIHVHGLVMTGWVVLLVIQSSLIVARQVQWHRRLGVLGAVWAVLVVVLGAVTTWTAAARDVKNHSPFAGIQVAVTGLELVQMVLFGGLVMSALALRRHTDIHKRLMLLTIACMLPSAVGRIPLDFISNSVILITLDLFVLGCVAIDTIRHRRLHPAFAWGGILILGTLHLAFYVVMTPWWHAVGTSLVS